MLASYHIPVKSVIMPLNILLCILLFCVFFFIVNFFCARTQIWWLQLRIRDKAPVSTSSPSCFLLETVLKKDWVKWPKTAPDFTQETKTTPRWSKWSLFEQLCLYLALCHFRHKIDIDWFERQYKWPEVKFQGVRWSFIWYPGMRNSTGSPLFPDFKSDLSRVARQEERRPWVRGWALLDLAHGITHFIMGL